jgi:hypothetical protein
LHNRLLDESLCLAVQVSRFGRRGHGHGPKQCRSYDELLTRAWWCVWVVEIEVGVVALTGLLA